jgi:hypothetical protein
MEISDKIRHLLASEVFESISRLFVSSSLLRNQQRKKKEKTQNVLKPRGLLTLSED